MVITPTDFARIALFAPRPEREPRTFSPIALVAGVLVAIGMVLSNA
jgi:hypothetical protein